MADRVLYQTDDDLSRDNLKNTQYRQNAVDYVERGLTLSNYDSSGLTVDLVSGGASGNHAVIDAGSGAAYDVFPDSRSGISLTDSTVNEIYVSIDPTTQDSISVDAFTSGTPSNPYVKVGEVDTSGDTTSDVNRDPDANFGTLSTDQIATDQGTVWDQPSNDPLSHPTQFSLIEAGSSISSTSFTTVARTSGGVDATRMPDAASLYGNLLINTGGSMDQETTVRPRVNDITNDASVELTELDLTIPSGNTFSRLETGWQSITSGSLQSAVFTGYDIQAQMTQQTNGDSAEPITGGRAGIIFEWRLD